MQESNRFKLGLFTCFGVFLFICVLLFLGVSDRFNDKAEIMTTVTESVQGLSRGSNVKFMGVSIGRVTDIFITPSCGLVEIVMEIDLTKIHHPQDESDMTAEWFYQSASQKIEKEGLRCQLCAEGITGMKYMDLGLVKDPPKYTREPGFKTSKIFYIPSVPSFITDMRTTFTSILEKLNAVDYEGISKKLITTLNSVERSLNDPNIASILKNLKVTSEEVASTVSDFKKTLTKEQIGEIVQNSNKTLLAVRRLSDLLEKELLEAQIGKTTEQARLTMEAFRVSNLHFIRTMLKINEGVDAVVELIQLLDEDPSSLIRGRSEVKKNGNKK